MSISWKFTKVEHLGILITTSKVSTKIVQSSLVEKMQFRVRVGLTTLPEHQVCSIVNFLCSVCGQNAFLVNFITIS